MRAPSENTLPEIVRAMATAFAGIPVEVLYGRDRFSSRPIVTANQIMVEQVGPEVFGPSMGTRSGASPTVGQRTIAVQVLIEAHSDRAGATESDHKLLANWFADLVWAFFLEEGQSRGETIEDERASGGFADVPDGEVGVGARYVLSFAIGRSVKRMDDMLSADLAELGIVPVGTTTVTSSGVTEIACGG